MAITYVDSTLAVHDSVAAYDIAAPAGLQPNDLLLLFTMQDKDTANNLVAADFTQVISNSGGANFYYSGHYRWVGANEPSTYTVGGGTGSSNNAVLLAFRGVDRNNPFANAMLASTSGSTTSQTAPAFNVTVLGAMAVAAWFNVKFDTTKSQGFSTISNGMQVAEINTNSYAIMAAGYKLLSATGSTNTFVATTKVAPEGVGNNITLALRPGATGPAAPTVDAGAATGTVPINGTFTRTATDSDNGDPITSRAWTIQSGPAGVGTTLSTTADVSWTPTTVGTYTLRYTATNGIGSGFEDITVTVTAAAPTVSAGPDTSTVVNQVFSRTADENNNGATITARSWKIQTGPTGVGTTIGTAVALSWTPTVTGTYTLRYSATNSVGTTTDDATVIVTTAPPSGPEPGRFLIAY